MVAQYIIEDGKTRSLEEFAKTAIEFLEKTPTCDEVVQLADHITELEHDKMTPPRNIHPLPEGYEYNFSGFSGQVIGVGRRGVGELHKLQAQRGTKWKD